MNVIATFIIIPLGSHNLLIVIEPSISFRQIKGVGGSLALLIRIPYS